MIYRRIPVSWYMIAVATIHPLLYYVVVSDVRYRYSLLWLSLLCAGYLLDALLEWLPSMRFGLKLCAILFPKYQCCQVTQQRDL